MKMKSMAPKAKPSDRSKVAAKPTRSLPAGTTVGKPGAVSKATKPMTKGKC